ncbi:MAG: sigma 54-interacting transcriptional regulator [Pseudomonadota bacterium]
MNILIISQQPELINRIAETAHHLAAYHVVIAAGAPLPEDFIPQVVLIDCVDDLATGLAALKPLRLSGRLRAAVAVGVVAAGDARTLEDLLAADFDEFLPAPLPRREELAVRLRLHERQSQARNAQALVEQKLAKASAHLIASRHDIHSILNHLRLGTAMIDADGTLTFLSQSAQQIFEVNEGSYLGRPWAEVISFKPQDTQRLEAIMQSPPAQREKAQLHLRTPRGRYFWLDVEVLDSPNEPARKIFFFYDMSEVHDLRRMVDEKTHFCDLVGKSKPMLQVYQTINEVATIDMTTLIEGETGTGKELVARAIHSLSHRKDKPFIAVNCGGLTDSLLTSQLFGHRRGAFTGAIEDHIGVFEAAGGGTLFLDEIGEIPLHVQTTLLRVLQEREVTRVGENTPRKIDVRLICATNRNLLGEVEAGKFRADLLYRIRVARIHMPPLRERKEDLPILVSALLTKKRASTGKEIDSISNQALRCLLDYHWPGNVRELENAIEFAVIRARTHTLHHQDLPPELLGAAAPEPQHAPAKPVSRLKERILDALSQTEGNRKEAAKLLGMSRATFYRKLAKLDIQDTPDFD